MGLVFRLDTMALFVAMGWGSAAQTFVGQNLGAQQERARAAERLDHGGATTRSRTSLLIALVFACGEAILRVFDDDAAPVAIALDYLHVVAPSYVALGVGIVLGNAMAGAGATRTTFAIDAVVILAFQVPLCLVAVGVMHGLAADALPVRRDHERRERDRLLRRLRARELARRAAHARPGRRVETRFAGSSQRPRPALSP